MNPPLKLYIVTRNDNRLRAGDVAAILVCAPGAIQARTLAADDAKAAGGDMQDWLNLVTTTVNKLRDEREGVVMRVKTL